MRICQGNYAIWTRFGDVVGIIDITGLIRGLVQKIIHQKLGLRFKEEKIFSRLVLVFLVLYSFRRHCSSAEIFEIFTYDHGWKFFQNLHLGHIKNSQFFRDHIGSYWIFS